MAPKFTKIKTPLEGLFVIEPTVYGDERGFFLEAYNKKDFSDIGITKDFVQDNHSKSTKGALRGLHFQVKYPQEKLVRVIRGAIFDVGVDLRKNSSTYKKFFGIELSEQNKKMLYLPIGFAHGFLSLTEEVDVIYKVTEHFMVEYDRGIIWNDPDIMIQWSFEKYGIEAPIVSKKDGNLPKLCDIDNPF